MNLRKYLLPAIVIVAVCLTLIAVEVYSNLINFGTVKSTPATIPLNISGKEVPLSIRVTVLGNVNDSVTAVIIGGIKQYLSHVQVVRVGGAGNETPEVLVLVLNNSSVIKDSNVVSMVKDVLCKGKLLIVTGGIKPINRSTLMNFLRKLGLDNVTFSNIKSAVCMKNIGGRPEHIYVFALQLTDGGCPSMHILSVEEGARVTLTSVRNYVINTIMDSFRALK